MRPGSPPAAQHALQFTARDDVEARAETCQHVQYTEVRVGLDGEADQVRHAFQRIGVSPVLGLDVGAGIDVGRRAEALRECGQCHALREELTVAVREGLHEQPPLEFETVFGTFFDGLLVIRQIQRTFLAAPLSAAAKTARAMKGSRRRFMGTGILEKSNRRSIPSTRRIAYASRTSRRLTGGRLA